MSGLASSRSIPSPGTSEILASFSVLHLFKRQKPGFTFMSVPFRCVQAVLPNAVPRRGCELSGVPRENPKWKENTEGKGATWETFPTLPPNTIPRDQR